jgi:hypothetical protein
MSKSLWKFGRRNPTGPSTIQPCISALVLIAVITAATCLVGCVDLTEPWKQKVTGTGGHPASGVDGSVGIEVGEGGAGGGEIDVAAGGSGGSIDSGLAGAGGGVGLGSGGAGDAMDLGAGGTGGAVDALADIPISSTGGVATGGATSGTGGKATGGATSGTGGRATGGTTNGTGGATGGTAGGSGGKATGGTTSGSGGKSTGGNSGTGGTGGGVDAAPPPPDGGTLNGLAVNYTCESLSGNVLPDSSGQSNNGTLVDAPPAPLDGGTAVRGYGIVSPGKVGSGALALTSASGGYVSMAPTILTGATEMTIATWVNLATTKAWARILDIGSSANTSANPPSGTTNVYMNLVPANNNGKPVFAITTSGLNNEQNLTGLSALPTGWTHVAIVLGGGTGTLYINGSVAATGAMSLRPANLGTIGYAYLGKSWFASDPYLDGQIDDFRVYLRALSAGDIQAVYSGL